MHCFCFLKKKMAESHRILIETYDDVAPLKHVNIGFVDLKVILL